MRLRSGNVCAVAKSPPPATPTDVNRRQRAQAVKQTPKRPRPKAELDSDLYEDQEVPVAKRRPNLRARGRKRVKASEDKEDSDFKTPVRGRPLRVLSTPVTSAARNIYSPIVRFLTPNKSNVPSSRGGVMSPELFVFGFGSVSPLSEEEDGDEVFSPFTFIKNIPPLSQHSRPTAKDIPPKTRSAPQATLVLDLDETLVFSSLNVIEEAEYTFYTNFQDHTYKAYMILRPYISEFLQAMAKVFEMFVYTSAKKEYGEKIVDILDPKRKLFRHRLYQEDCSCVLGHYVKDLSVLERDLKKTVILDNAPHTYPYHLMNMIPIKSWSGEEEDRELQRLIPYLEKLAEADDVREVLKRRTDHFHRLLSED
ncbi:CTD small phosphatase-like protein 3 [Denticeps clupeoides]|uniref:FCP1 homology domain-containing protein n=1 Tax=Denticeps clupeoides TaxID=299321 RepID=A0AAY4CRX7_9TELE|nr:CTD small phosphatase-like protein 3 [Denticeps clupeoides]